MLKNIKINSNANLDNAALGTIKGKFADTSTIKVDANDTHVNLAVKPGSIDNTLFATSAVTAEKVNGTDKRAWADKIADLTGGVDYFGMVRLNHTDNVAFATTTTKAKNVLGIKIVQKELASLKEQLGQITDSVTSDRYR